MRNSLMQWWQSLLSSWLNRRLPATRQLRLSHRSIFIVPSRFGVLYIALLLVMLLTGINYQNSLIYGLTFWLFSLGLVAMLLTFRNLAGLKLSAGRAQPCFVGENTALPIILMANKRAHEAIRLAFVRQAGILARVSALEEQEIQLNYYPKQRGPLRVERILIESYFPLGLFRAWSWVQLDFHGIVYPQPEFTPLQLAQGEISDEYEGEHSHAGNQDFYGLRVYQQGDSLNRIAWKQVAQGKGLITKEFSEDAGGEFVFSYQSLAGLPVETRLKRLCGWIIQAHEQGDYYGLELPSQSLPLAAGQQHLHQCLQALALFQHGEVAYD